MVDSSDSITAGPATSSPDWHAPAIIDLGIDGAGFTEPELAFAT